VTHWLSTAPAWLSFVVLVLGWNALALGAMQLCRRWSANRGLTAGPPVVNSWATAAGALTALVFTFTIVTLWNQAIRADSNVDDEAAAIRAVERDIAPSQVALVKNYVRLTVNEWPQLCGGKESDDVNAALILLEATAQPRADKYADNLFQTLGTVEDMRNRRWQVSESSVPGEIWVALFVLSCVLLTILGMAMPDHSGTHAILMVSAGTALGTLFWVTNVLEFPFCGSNAIRPDEILAILRMHMM
jgi:hypothetical protein